jgi:hypothetical protein
MTLRALVLIRPFRALIRPSRGLSPYKALKAAIRSLRALQGPVGPYKGLKGLKRPYKALKGLIWPLWTL